MLRSAFYLVWSRQSATADSAGLRLSARLFKWRYVRRAVGSEGAS